MNMIAAENPSKILVTTISNSGYALIDSLRSTFKDIKWIVRDSR
jgi:hypothetical protein